MFICLFVVGIFVAARCEALSRLPNARYLGMGYNAITGNPDNNLHDPGFAFSVLKFTWANNVTTSDGKYFVPDNVQALQTRSCGFQSQAATEFGSRSYQQALSIDVSVESEANMLVWSARFSGSVEYKKVSQGTIQHRRIYTSARAKCIHYQLSVNYLNAPVTITSNFAQAVGSLPLVQNDNAYKAFIRTYGTHFTRSMTMGAKMVIRSEFDEVALTRMEEAGLSIEIGAKASFLRFAGGLNAETRTERQQRETFEGNRRSFSASYLGSHPPSDQKWETWANSTADSPYPVKYLLVPITNLFTAKFFPDMSLDDLNTRRDLLTAAFSIYCSGTDGCGTPIADRVPVRMAKSVSRFIGSATVSCPPTYNLVSCGILNVRASGHHDKQRYAVPASTSACQCHDNTEAQCVSWCANIAVQYRIVSSALVQGSTTATCPAGYKVLGCHAKYNSANEKWPRQYPRSDGNACLCYNYFGVNCIASCASNIRNHEVRHQYGTGTVTVTCSTGNFVLGCGMRPKYPSDHFEKWRTWAVKTLDSCQCYDYYGVTCYALCGQLT